MTPTKPSELSFDEIKEKLQARYCPESTTILHRYQFHNLKQQSESVSEFLSALRRKAAKCDYGAFPNEALRDQFVCGLSDEHTQKKLLRTKDLKLEFAVSTALAMEAARKDVQEIQQQSSNAQVFKISNEATDKG